MKLSAPPPPPPEPPEPGPTSGPAPEPNPGGNPAPETAADASPSTPPESKPESKPATWPGWFAGMDVALAGLAVVLGFLLASFAAHNSDVWLHLGAGRMLTTGEYRLGSDPLSYTAADRPWVNHSWLFDLGAYLLYSGDGFLLVLAKALAVAAAVGLVLAIRRPGQSLWPWAVLAAVAVVAGAMQLTLRPLVGSIFFLALTLFLVFRLPSPPGSWRLPVAVGVTFWFWANVDAWFVLGPAVLALLLIGELVRRRMTTPGDPAAPADDPLGPLPDAATLGRALVVGVVACMLNPHHVRVWELPFELVGAGPTVDTDPRIAPVLMSPVRRIFWENAGWGRNAQGLAYALLLAAGLYAGFLAGAVGRVLGRWAEIDPLPLPHVLLWIGFAGLSLLTITAIPFLALVTVPLVASRLNALSARVVLGPRADRRTRLVLTASAAGRLASLVGLLALCVIAWPGWLYGAGGSNPALARRVEWAVDPDPGLRRAAEWLREERAAGRLPADVRGFLGSIDLANYCAWYAPGEKVFANSRYAHHRPDLAAFTEVRRGLGLYQADEPPDPRETDEVFRRNDVRYVGVATAIGDSGPMRASVQFAVVNMWAGWNRWAPWYLDGRAAISGWRPSPAETRPPFDQLRLDPVALAFGPGAEKLPPGKVDPVPPPRGPLDEFFTSPRPTPVEADEALWWLEYKGVAERRGLFAYHAAKLLQLNVPGVAVPPVVPAAFQARDEEYSRQSRALAPAPRSTDGTLLAPPLLAVKAARKAIAAAPNHPDGYFALALALGDRDLPLTESEREIGIITAYRQCLSRMPPPAEFRPGAYLTSPTQAASELARLYLNPPSPDSAFYRGTLVDLPGLREMVGQVLVADARGARRVPYGMPVPPNVQSFGPVLLPLDLARQALVLAADYADREAARMNPEDRQAMIKRLEDQRKRVDRELQRATEQFRTMTQKQPSPKDRFGLAIQQNLVGEAIDTLRGVKDGLDKEFGEFALEALLKATALELAVGQLEEAAADMTVLADVLDRLAAEPRGDQRAQDRLRALRGLLRRLEYEKLVLEGSYAAAGAELEALEGKAVERTAGAPVPPPSQALGLNWPAAAAAPLDLATSAAVTLWYRDRIGQYQMLRQGIFANMNQTATFFFRRGFLSLLEGDVEAARARFLQCDRPAPPGWDLREVKTPEAVAYLRLIDAARKKAGGR